MLYTPALATLITNMHDAECCTIVRWTTFTVNCLIVKGLRLIDSARRTHCELSS